MTVAELIKQLQELPDDMLVVSPKPGTDAIYKPTTIGAVVAVRYFTATGPNIALCNQECVALE